MTTEDTQFTVGQTTFYQGENGTHPLFRIEPGIPCRDAREQSSELMGYVRELTIIGLMDEKPMMIWAAPTGSVCSWSVCIGKKKGPRLARALGLSSAASRYQWNCSSSVEPVSAVTDDAPP